MLRKVILSAVTLFALSLGTSAAFADECSGRDHAGGTIVGGILGGALLGGLAGNAVSRDMDCEDRPYAARAYDNSFRGPVGRRQEWNRGQYRGYVVTTREYRRNGEMCRNFTQVVYRRGRELTRDGTACRPMRGGDWRFR